MTIKVQKYGGTSVGTIDKIKNIAKRIIDEKKKGNNLVIVVSAMGKTTNRLIEMAKEISDNPCKRELDMLVSTGEQTSIALLSIALKEYGSDSVSLTGFQAGIKTHGIHTKNRITDIDINNIKEHLSQGKIVVVAGFQGINEKGDITTLGRGGSDTTAVALAARLNCSCEIYTDVDGIYSVDPRLYSEAKKLNYISYEEMMEMSSLGASVMETRAVEIGHKYKVPIYVAQSHGNSPGTYIKEYDDKMEQKVITGLTVNDDVLMVSINHIPYNSKNISLIFKELAKQEINVDMISQTAPYNGYVNLSFTTTKDALQILNKIVCDLKIEIETIDSSIVEDITKLSVVGIGMITQCGVASDIFELFAENSIDFKQVTTSEISISYTINSSDKEKAVKILAKELNL